MSGTAWRLSLEYASDHPRLLNRHAPETDDHHRAAAKIRTDPGLPEALRAVWVEPAEY